MQNTEWEAQFRGAYSRAREAYEGGAETPEECVAKEDLGFLAGIGCSAQELFDLVEDDVAMGEPGIEGALRITAVRRDYFLQVQDGRSPGRIWHPSEFPPPGAMLGGIPWLPRIIAKAQAKLRGELPPDLMYCCGGDRRFLQEHGLDPAAFLRVVWEADEGRDPQRVLAYVQRRGAP